MKSFNFTEEDKAFMYLLYGSDPSSDYLVQFALLKNLVELNTNVKELLDYLKGGDGFPVVINNGE